MDKLMDALGVALCCVLATCVILGCVAFVVSVRRIQREEKFRK